MFISQFNQGNPSEFELKEETTTNPFFHCANLLDTWRNSDKNFNLPKQESEKIQKAVFHQIKKENIAQKEEEKRPPHPEFQAQNEKRKEPEIIPHTIERISLKESEKPSNSYIESVIDNLRMRTYLLLRSLHMEVSLHPPHTRTQNTPQTNNSIHPILR